MEADPTSMSSERVASLVLQAKEDKHTIETLQNELRIEREKNRSREALVAAPHQKSNVGKPHLPPTRARRPGSAVGCKHDMDAAMPDMLLTSNIELMDSLKSLQRASTEVEVQLRSQIAALEKERDVKDATIEALMQENTSLKQRVACDTLRRSELGKIRRHTDKVRCVDRMRQAAQARQEALERNHMATLDDAYYITRATANTAPTRQVFLVAADFIPEEACRHRVGDLFSQVLYHYYSVLQSTSSQLDGHLIGRRGAQVLHAFHRAQDALSFARRSAQQMAAQPWPETLTTDSDFCSFANGLLLGPRVRFGISGGSPTITYSPRTGNIAYSGNVVRDVAAYVFSAVPGEILTDDETLRQLGSEALLRPEEVSRRSDTVVSVHLLGQHDVVQVPVSPAVQQEFAAKERTVDIWSVMAAGDGGSKMEVPSITNAERKLASAQALSKTKERACEALENMRMLAEDHYHGDVVHPPRGEQVVLCMCDLPDIDTIPTELQESVLATLHEHIKRLAYAQGGYIVKSQKDIAFVAFEEAMAATAFATDIHLALIQHSWEPQLLETPTMGRIFEDNDSRRRLIYNGPRIRAGIDMGPTHLDEDPVTGHADYQGCVASRVAHMCALARPGESIFGGNLMRLVKAQKATSTTLTICNKGTRQLGNCTSDIYSVVPAKLGPRAKVWLKSSKQLEQVQFAKLAAVLYLRPQEVPQVMTPFQARTLRMLNRIMKRHKDLREQLRRAEVAQMAQHDASGMLGSVPPATTNTSLTTMFVDLQGSQKLFDQFGETFVRCQQYFNKLMTDAVSGVDGYIVKHNNYDAFMFVFNTPADAVEAALTVQYQLLMTDWPPELVKNDHALKVRDKGTLLFSGLRVRCGIAYGVVTPKTDGSRMDYTGPSVTLAHKISRLAAGGDVWISQSTMEELQKKHTRLLDRVKATPTGDSKLAAFSVLHPSLAGRLTRFPTDRGAKLDETKIGNWWRNASTATATAVQATSSPKLQKKNTTVIAPTSELPIHAERAEKLRNVMRVLQPMEAKVEEIMMRPPASPSNGAGSSEMIALAEALHKLCEVTLGTRSLDVSLAASQFSPANQALGARPPPKLSGKAKSAPRSSVGAVKRPVPPRGKRL